MQLYVLDNMRGDEMCREWDKMLPPFEWVELSEREPAQLVNDMGQIISPVEQEKSLLLIHRSSILNLDDQAWFRCEYRAPILVAHGDLKKLQEPLDDLPETDKVYYLKSALGLNDRGFSRRFHIFLNKYQVRGELHWELLEPPGTVTLSAIYILCQGYLSAYTSVAEIRPGNIVKRALNAMDRPGIGSAISKHSDGDILLMWSYVFDGVDVLAQAEVEWGGENEGWGRVVPLLRSIEQLDNGATLILDADEVATAYCALAIRLGGNPC